VGIHGDSRLTKGGIQNNIGSFAPDTRQCLKAPSIAGHLAPVVVDEVFASLQNITSLGTVEANSADKGYEPVFAKGEHAGRVGRDLKQALCGFIDPAIRSLGRQNDGNQQLKNRSVVKLGGRVRIVRLEPFKEDFPFDWSKANPGFARRGDSGLHQEAPCAGPPPGLLQDPLSWPRGHARSCGGPRLKA